MTISTDRKLDSLERVQHQLDAQLLQMTHPGAGKKAGEPPITIALSRQAGSGGEEVARAVGERLGWPVYDHELLDRIGEEKKVHVRKLEDVDERRFGWLEEAIRSFCSPGSGRTGAYLKGLLEVLASLGKEGHCVIVGRGASQVLPADTTLSVRVVAPRAARVAAVAKRLNLPVAEAERKTDSTDGERLRFVKECFRADAADPALYDLVLNTRRLGVDECAALVVQASQALASQAAKHAVG